MYSRDLLLTQIITRRSISAAIYHLNLLLFIRMLFSKKQRVELSKMKETGDQVKFAREEKVTAEMLMGTF